MSADPFAGCDPADLEDGQPWFVAGDVEGDPRSEAPPTEEGHVWVITDETPHNHFEDEGAGLSLVLVAATAAAAMNGFEAEHDDDPLAWYRPPNLTNFWTAVRWDRDGHQRGWRIYSLTEIEITQ